jgi:hypothetical protein
MKPRTRKARKAAPRLPGYLQDVAFSKAGRRKGRAPKDAAALFLDRAGKQRKPPQ